MGEREEDVYGESVSCIITTLYEKMVERNTYNTVLILAYYVLRKDGVFTY